MLKANLRSLRPECLVKMVFKKNPTLYGTLAVTSYTPYSSKDTTRSGDSMDGWRRFVLAADEDFLAAIAPYPDNHRFQLGSSGIQIWGGAEESPATPS